MFPIPVRVRGRNIPYARPAAQARSNDDDDALRRQYERFHRDHLDDPEWRVVIRLRGPTSIIPNRVREPALCAPNKVTWERWLREQEIHLLDPNEWEIEALRHRDEQFRPRQPLNTNVKETLAYYKLHPVRRPYVAHLVRRRPNANNFHLRAERNRNLPINDDSISNEPVMAADSQDYLRGGEEASPPIENEFQDQDERQYAIHIPEYRQPLAEINYSNNDLAFQHGASQSAQRQQQLQLFHSWKQGADQGHNPIPRLPQRVAIPERVPAPAPINYNDYNNGSYSGFTTRNFDIPRVPQSNPNPPNLVSLYMHPYSQMLPLARNQVDSRPQQGHGYHRHEAMYNIQQQREFDFRDQLLNNGRTPTSPLDLSLQRPNQHQDGNRNNHGLYYPNPYPYQYYQH